MIHELPLTGTAAAQPINTDWLRDRSGTSNANAVAGHVMNHALTWETYRLALAAPIGPLDPYHVFLIENVWGSLKKIAPLLPDPEASPSEDGRIFGMTWDRNNHHFEIEILPSGKYEWFYMDFSSRVRQGEDDVQIGIYSREMRECLLKTLSA